MTIVLSEGAISLMTTDELVKQSFASVKVGALEIRPGSTRHVRCLAACRSEQSARWRIQPLRLLHNYREWERLPAARDVCVSNAHPSSFCAPKKSAIVIFASGGPVTSS